MSASSNPPPSCQQLVPHVPEFGDRLSSISPPFPQQPLSKACARLASPNKGPRDSGTSAPLPHRAVRSPRYQLRLFSLCQLVWVVQVPGPLVPVCRSGEWFIPQKKVVLPVMTMTRTPSSFAAECRCSRNTVIRSCERAFRLEGLFNARTRTPAAGVEGRIN